mgnify:CR=1 FL=1
MPGGDSAAWQTFSRPAGSNDWLPQRRLGSRNLAGSGDAPGCLRTPSPRSKYAERDTREEEKEKRKAVWVSRQSLRLLTTPWEVPHLDGGKVRERELEREREERERMEEMEVEREDK